MRRRQAFTLVELLVSMALIIFIMSILSYAFSAAVHVFRDLKAVGDMNKKLRMAAGILRRDLAADHFEGKKRLSDPNFWTNGPPQQGFFRIWQGSAGTYEGADQDNITSYRSVDHMLHFAARLSGNTRSDYFLAAVPSGSPLAAPVNGIGIDSRYQDSGPFTSNNYPYAFQWAEVAYFLRASINEATNTQDTANGTPLYTLYRRQRLATVDDVPTTPYVAGTYLEISASQDPTAAANFYFNSAIDLAVPPRRFAMDSNMYPVRTATASDPNTRTYPTLAEQSTTSATPNNTSLAAADVLINEVVSFDVRFLPTDPNTQDFVDLFHPNIQAYGVSGGSSLNPNFNFQAGTGPLVFDTWASLKDNYYDYSSWATPGTAKSVPLYQNSSGAYLGIKAVQVTIRIWDAKTEQTRQISVIQDL